MIYNKYSFHTVHNYLASYYDIIRMDKHEMQEYLNNM